MSKFFDKLQKMSYSPPIERFPEMAKSTPLGKTKDIGQHSFPVPFRSSELDIDGLLENAKKANPRVAELPGFRPGNRRKAELDSTSETLAFSRDHEVSPLLMEAYRSLRTRLLRIHHSQRVRSVVITSSIADEGKTLTLMNLALCCAQLPNLRILLVDGDMRTAGLTRLLGNPPGPGLAQVLAGEINHDEAIVSTNLPNLHAMPAGRPSRPPGELFAGPRWMEFLEWSSECFTLVLVDSPPVLSLADFELIAAACDGVLIVVRALTTPRELLKEAARQIEKRKLLGAIFNGVERSTDDSVYYRDYHDYDGKDRAPVNPRQQKSD
jgi:capsular exopolysaccharide synthesis family protein